MGLVIEASTTQNVHNHAEHVAVCQTGRVHVLAAAQQADQPAKVQGD